MNTVLLELQQLGYEIWVERDQIRLKWRRAADPPRAEVLPLLAALRRDKAGALEAVRCPRCGGCQFYLAGFSGTRFCRRPGCRAIYNPSKGEWTAPVARKPESSPATPAPALPAPTQQADEPEADEPPHA
jgi:hypothetical protein